MRQINYIIICCSATKAERDFHAEDIDKINNWILRRDFRNLKVRQYEEETITLGTDCSSYQTFIGKGQSFTDW